MNEQAYGVFERLLSAGVQNVCSSFYDSFMETNSQTRYRAGLKQILVRKQIGRCCDWCAQKAGTYRYPDEIPDGIFQRHLNCRCQVVVKTEKGRWMDAWSKKEFSTQKEARIERAKEIEQENADMRKFLASDTYRELLKDSPVRARMVLSYIGRTVPKEAPAYVRAILEREGLYRG